MTDDAQSPGRIVYVVVGRHYDQSEPVAVYGDRETAEKAAKITEDDSVGRYEVVEFEVSDEPESRGAYF